MRKPGYKTYRFGTIWGIIEVLKGLEIVASRGQKIVPVSYSVKKN